MAFDAIEEPVFQAAAPNRAVRALRKLFRGKPVTTEAIAAEMGVVECSVFRALAKGVKAGLAEPVGCRLGWKPAGAELEPDTKRERRRRQYRDSYHRRKLRKRKPR